MKRGFLLSKRKGDLPNREEDGDASCHLPPEKSVLAATTDTTNNNTQIPITPKPQHSSMIIKRGFLLNPSTTTHLSSCGTTRIYPPSSAALSSSSNNNCSSNCAEGSSIHKVKRIQTRSAALLDEAFIDDVVSTGPSLCGLNQPFKPITSSNNILHFIRNESVIIDEEEGANTSTMCKSNIELRQHHHHIEQQSDHNIISLDDWIEPSSLTSTSTTTPSITLPSLTPSGSPQQTLRTSNNDTQLIVEMDSDDVTNNIYDDASGTNAKVLLSNDDLPLSTEYTLSRTSLKDTAATTITDFPEYSEACNKIVTNATTPNDAYHIANQVSILLSKLRRSIHKTTTPANTRRDKERIIGLGTIVNITTEQMIQSFVRKTLCHHPPREAILDTIVWGLILESIAQDYIEFIQKIKNKNKRKRSWYDISPSLALGLGILEFLNPAEGAYASLVRQLTNTPKGVSKQNNENISRTIKERKILALGGVYLVRCRIRCMNISLMNLEISAISASPCCGDASAMSRRLTVNIEPEINSLFSIVLPSLESIVHGRDQTILTSAAADACFELLEVMSRFDTYQRRCLQNIMPGATTQYNLDQIRSSITKRWKDVMPLIERLLVTKKRWVTSLSSSSKISEESGKTKCSLRRSCATAVVMDWMNVIKISKHNYFNYLVGDNFLEGCDTSAESDLFFNLSGILMKKAGDDDNTSVVTYCGAGGIGQSLCQQKECFFGNIAKPVYASDTDIIALLQESSRLTDIIRDSRLMNSTKHDAVTKFNHQRVSVRAFASWCLSGNKETRILTQSNRNLDEADANYLDSSMVSLIMMLKTESTPLTSMSIAALSLMWSLSPDWMPQSFEDLLDTLYIHSTQTHDDIETESSESHIDAPVLSTTCKVLCMIVAKAALKNPIILLPSILNMKGSVDAKIEVILTMLDIAPSIEVSATDSAQFAIQQAASDVLLENIASSSYLRSRLRSNPSLFTNTQSHIIIPKIVKNLVKKYAKRQSDNGVSSLAEVLCNIMKVSAVSSERAEEFVRCVLSSVQSSTRTDTNTEVESAIRFFNKSGALWRLALCRSNSTSDFGYKHMLIAAARSMIEQPSSSIPLAAFASLVDAQLFNIPSSTDKVATECLEKMIFIATLSIIQISMNEMLLFDKSDRKSIFSRLAPLLILRRVPRSYYRVVHEKLPFDRDARDALSRLASFLWDELKILSMVDDSTETLVKDEKKLLAELLGHCLPLTNKCIDTYSYSSAAFEFHVSLYDFICKNTFSDFLEKIKQLDNRRTTQFIPGKLSDVDTSQVKAALYAVCYQIPLAMNEDNGEELINVASFAFEILNYQHTNVNGYENARFIHEMQMLNSGCIHFLAVCVDSLSRRKANGIGVTQSTPLIQDFDDTGNADDLCTRNTILGALLCVFQMLVSVIKTGKSNVGIKLATNHFSPSSRTAMLNLFVMVTKGSSEVDDARVHWLAFCLLPFLLEWISNGSIDDNIYHPLCVAASLQVVYTILARCGSFEWLSRSSHDGKLASISETQFVCRTLQSVLKIFHTKQVRLLYDASAISTLRLASLKVMLTILAIHNSQELISEYDTKCHLRPPEIQKAIAAILGAANVDHDPEVRQLASQVLPRLIHV